MPWKAFSRQSTVSAEQDLVDLARCFYGLILKNRNNPCARFLGCSKPLNKSLRVTERPASLDK